jgi:hypothetical protein
MAGLVPAIAVWGSVRPRPTPQGREEAVRAEDDPLLPSTLWNDANSRSHLA